MTLLEKIEHAFGHRKMPAEVIEPEQYIQLDSDVEEAIWFADRDWQNITAKDWQEHSCALNFLSTDAFGYYLPSLLSLEVSCPEATSMAVDSLIYLLDMSTPVGALDERLMRRFSGFSSEEYDVLKEWLIYMSEYAPNLGTRTSGPGDTYARVFQTIDSLQQEAQLQNMIKQEQMGSGAA